MFNNQDNAMELIITDILFGLKNKFVQPVLDENKRLLSQLEDLAKQDKEGMADLKDRVTLLEQKLEQKIEEVPVLVLSAIRDAINQAAEEE